MSGMGVVYPEISLEMQSGTRGGGSVSQGQSLGLFRTKQGGRKRADWKDAH